MIRRIDDPPDTFWYDMSPIFPLKIEGLIPHRPPMLTVDELVQLEGEEAVSRTVFGPDSIFVNDRNELEEAVLFEMMAQTFAAAAALNKTGPRLESGFLVGLKKMVLLGPGRPGSPITVKIRVAGRVEAFSIVEGEARQDEELLASGQLTIYVPEEAPDEGSVSGFGLVFFMGRGSRLGRG